MNINVSKYAGACFGVNRSIEMLMSEIESGHRVATLGDIIHNPETVHHLKHEYGVEVADSPNIASDLGVDTLIIRSHGVAVDVENAANDLGIRVVDATCPHVKNVQKTAYDLAKKYGAVLIIGKYGHPEVDGVLSYVKEADGQGFVANSLEELEGIFSALNDFSCGIGVVAQTTSSQETFEAILSNLNDRGVVTHVENTICLATKRRQDSALKAASSADIVIVLGGYNSSNTTHLKDICQTKCSCVYHIQSVDEAKTLDFTGVESVLICAGASTPKNQIQSLYDYLKKFA